MGCLKSTGIVSAVVFFLATLAICLWIGVAMLVPQAPFDTRNIAGGVCLLMFVVLIGVSTGVGYLLDGESCALCHDDDR